MGAFRALVGVPNSVGWATLLSRALAQCLRSVYPGLPWAVILQFFPLTPGVKTVVDNISQLHSLIDSEVNVENLLYTKSCLAQFPS